jgi:siroheme synthase (precorrin-2 oxidase/ferrochelatase)
VAQSKDVENFLNQQLATALKRYSSAMDEERKKRQQVVDSLAEYERVNKLCK